MILITWTSRHVYLNGWNDFLSFYAGGKLAFTNQLYDPAAISDVQFQAAHTSGPALRFIRLPHYAMLLWPMAQLPYLKAYVVWQLLNITGVLGAVWLWPYSKMTLAHTFAVWLPLYWAFIGGQDLGLLLMAMSATIRHLSLSNGQAAGCALSGCLIKYHFIWLAPVALMRRPRTLVIATAVSGTLLLIPLGFNTQWPSQYCNAVLLSRTIISNTPVSLFPFLGWYGLLLGAAGIAMLAWRCTQVMAFTSSVAIAVAVSPHAYFQDYALVAPLIALCFDRRVKWRARHSSSEASEPMNIGERVSI